MLFLFYVNQYFRVSHILIRMHKSGKVNILLFYWRINCIIVRIYINCVASIKWYKNEIKNINKFFWCIVMVPVCRFIMVRLNHLLRLCYYCNFFNYEKPTKLEQPIISYVIPFTFGSMVYAQRHRTTTVSLCRYTE